MPHKYHFLYATSALLLLLVLTNDFHRLVFINPELMHSHSYGPVYFMILAYLLLVSTAGIVTLWRRSRIPEKQHRMQLVFLPFSAIIVYAIGYVLRIHLLMFIFFDMTAVYCVCIFTLIEICIVCGLIPSNTHYRDLFAASSVSALITDHQNKVLLTSDAVPSLSADTIRQTSTGAIVLEDGHRLSSFDTSFGHVLWLEDISDLLARRDELTYANEYLSEHNTALAEEYKTNRFHEQLVTRNQLYNTALTQTADQIVALSRLVEELDQTTDATAERRLLLHICLLGTYLKRRMNLFLLAEEQTTLPMIELEHSIREISQNLELFEISFACYVKTAASLPFHDMVFLFDALMTVLEATVDRSPSYYVTVQPASEQTALIIRLAGLDELPTFALSTLRTEDEGDGEWLLTIPTEQGGEHPWAT